MALSASMDLLTFTIPNRLCAALALGYLVFAALLGVSAVDILLNISCALAILIIAFVMFNLGWVGGGDAKLAAATAAWLGWTAILDYGLAAALFGGILTLIILGARWRLCPPSLAVSIGLPDCTMPTRACLRNCVGGGGVDAISRTHPSGRRSPEQPVPDRLRTDSLVAIRRRGGSSPKAAVGWSDSALAFIGDRQGMRISRDRRCVVPTGLDRADPFVRSFLVDGQYSS